VVIALAVLFVCVGFSAVLFLALLVVDWIEPGTTLEAHELDGYPERGK
jgi:hypothetical protein